MALRVGSPLGAGGERRQNTNSPKRAPQKRGGRREADGVVPFRRSGSAEAMKERRSKSPHQNTNPSEFGIDSFDTVPRDQTYFI